MRAFKCGKEKLENHESSCQLLPFIHFWLELKVNLALCTTLQFKSAYGGVFCQPEPCLYSKVLPLCNEETMQDFLRGLISKESANMLSDFRL